MGCSGSKSIVSPGANAWDDKIGQQLAKEAANNKRHFKILTLGAGESGKSTLVKQLDFLYKPPLSDAERKAFIVVLHSNTIQCLVVLLNAAAKFGYELSPEEQESADLVSAQEGTRTFAKDLVPHIQRLWQSEAIKQAFERRNEFWLLESASYYFDHVQRFVQVDFIPSDEDIIMARKRTTGVVVSAFDLDGVSWSVVDVGGQRSERRKWLHCFDDIKAAMFVVNLSGFHKVLFEDRKVNRMQESLDLFTQTMEHPLFRTPEVQIFLLFNKFDLFSHSIQSGVHLSSAFPSFKGPQLDPKAARDFLAQEFKKALPPSQQKKAVTCFLSARLRDQVTDVFGTVKDVLLQKNQGTVGEAEEKVPS